MLTTKMGMTLMGGCLAWLWVNSGLAQPVGAGGATVSVENIIRNTQNDTSWRVFTDKVKALSASGSGTVTIVQLGDSHIQGGYFSNRVRELLRHRYGSAGRGLVFPYSLLQTNGPDDVGFVSPATWVGDKYNHTPPGSFAGIAGYTLSVTDSMANLAIVLKPGSDSLYPITRVKVYHSSPFLHVRSGAMLPVVCQKLDSSLYVSMVDYAEPCDSVMLRLSCSGLKTAPQIYGVELIGSRPGIRFHTMGVNGASYDSYAKMIQYMPMLQALQPDCILLSLGTNDSYVSKLDTALLRRRVTSMIDRLRKAIPGCTIMLTTPGDHLWHRESVNPNVSLVHSLLTSVAISKNCVYWDFFELMGGLGSSRNWQKRGWMYKDVLHLSKEGYKVQGEMFFEALKSAM